MKIVLKNFVSNVAKLMRIYLGISFPDYIYKHLSFSGVFKFKVSNRFIHYKNYQDARDEISNHIFYSGIFGNFEGLSLRIWNYLCSQENDSIILDLGGYTGIYSLIAANANHNNEIHTFEPHPETYLSLKSNINLNSFHNIVPHNLALAEKSGMAKFKNSVGIHPSGFSMINNEDAEKDSAYIECETISVKWLLNNIVKTKRLSLIKIDIERGELPVLTKLHSRILRDRTIVLCEILDKKDYQKFDDLFYHHGFEAIMINEFSKKAIKLGLLSGNYRADRNVLFVPREKDLSFLDNLR